MNIREYGKKINIKDAKTIAIELPFGLGDKIMCFPLLYSLKKQTSAKIILLSPNASSRNLFLLNPYVDEIIDYNLPKFTYKNVIKLIFFGFIKLRKKIKESCVDVFICTHYNLLRKIFLMFLPYKYGVINHENKHKGLQIKDILDFFGLETFYDYTIIPEYTGILERVGLKEREYIVIDIYPQHLEKDPRRWYYFDELISYLKSRYKYKVVIVGINKNHIERNDVVDLINKTRFKELLDVVRFAKLIINLDTFIFHLSYSFKVPLIALFGPVNPSDRVPLDKNDKIFVLYKALNCSPCIKNKVDIDCKNGHKCMKDIKPGEVVSLVEKILN